MRAVHAQIEEASVSRRIVWHQDVGRRTMTRRTQKLARLRSGGVLVNCWGGVNRSAAVAVGFLVVGKAAPKAAAPDAAPAPPARRAEFASLEALWKAHSDAADVAKKAQVAAAPDAVGKLRVNYLRAWLLSAAAGLQLSRAR